MDEHYKVFIDEQNDYINNLSDIDKYYINLYTHTGDGVLNKFVRNNFEMNDLIYEYFITNRKLVCNKKTETKQQAKCCLLNFFINLQRIIDNAPKTKHEFILYRGMDSEMKSNDKCYVNGFFSTTLDDNIANAYGNFLLKINLPVNSRCLYINSISHFPSELEVLLGSDNILKHISENNYTLIQKKVHKFNFPYTLSMIPKIYPNKLNFTINDVTILTDENYGYGIHNSFIVTDSITDKIYQLIMKYKSPELIFTIESLKKYNEFCSFAECVSIEKIQYDDFTVISNCKKLKSIKIYDLNKSLITVNKTINEIKTLKTIQAEILPMKIENDNIENIIIDTWYYHLTFKGYSNLKNLYIIHNVNQPILNFEWLPESLRLLDINVFIIFEKILNISQLKNLEYFSTGQIKEEIDFDEFKKLTKLRYFSCVIEDISEEYLKKILEFKKYCIERNISFRYEFSEDY